MHIHHANQTFNIVTPNLHNLIGQVARLRRVPTLTEAEAGLLNVAIKVLERANGGADLDAQLSAMAVADKVRDLARRVVPVVSDGVFARKIWGVERQPRHARNRLDTWITPTERRIDG